MIIFYFLQQCNRQLPENCLQVCVGQSAGQTDLEELSDASASAAEEADGISSSEDEPLVRNRRRPSVQEDEVSSSDDEDPEPPRKRRTTPSVRAERPESKQAKGKKGAPRKKPAAQAEEVGCVVFLPSRVCTLFRQDFNQPGKCPADYLKYCEYDLQGSYFLHWLINAMLQPQCFRAACNCQR